MNNNLNKYNKYKFKYLYRLAPNGVFNLRGDTIHFDKTDINNIIILKGISTIIPLDINNNNKNRYLIYHTNIEDYNYNLRILTENNISTIPDTLIILFECKNCEIFTNIINTIEPIDRLVFINKKEAK